MALEISVGEPSPWWERTLRKYVSAQKGWRADLSAFAMERAAWVACATSMACLKLATTDEAAWRPVADRLFEIVEPELGDWLWKMGYPSSARAALPALLVRLAVLDGISTLTGDRVKRVATAAPDSRTLASILEASRGLSIDILNDLEQLHAERVRYEAELASGA